MVEVKMDEANSRFGLEGLRWTLLGLALLITSLCFWQWSKPLLGHLRSADQQASTSLNVPLTLTQKQEALEAIPAYRAYFYQLKQNFPNDYQSAMQVNDPVQDQAWPDRQMILAMESLRESHGVLAAEAPLGVLQEIDAAFLGVMNQLEASDPHLCVEFSYNGNEAGFDQFVHQHRDSVAALGMAWMNAILAGQQQRNSADVPTDEDLQFLDDALSRQGLDRETIDALLDGKSPANAPSDTDLCHARIVFIETLLQLPQDTRLRLLAQLAILRAHS